MRPLVVRMREYFFDGLLGGGIQAMMDFASFFRKDDQFRAILRRIFPADMPSRSNRFGNRDSEPLSIFGSPDIPLKLLPGCKWIS